MVVLGVALWGLLSMAAVSPGVASHNKPGSALGDSKTSNVQARPSDKQRAGWLAGGKPAGGKGATSSSATPGGSNPGGVTSSGGSSPITYQTIRKSYEAAGRVLFEATCSSCHGANAYGTSRAPSLVGLGAGTVDLWVSNGWMPLENLTSQPAVKPSRYTTKQSQEIADFVASLSKVNGPGIPKVNLQNVSVSQGMSLFALNCAACHTITGSGDALGSGYFAPTLHLATKTQVAEAARTGPGNMPRFSPKQLSNKELADIDAYVTRYIQHPVNRGGLALGGVGPVAEGFIALLVGVGVLMLAAFWIGDHRR
jgi:ubiquinol-cytochrome c reductase cytochrome c subunit